MKALQCFLMILFLGHLLGGAGILYGAEEYKGFVIIDRKPWKTSWFQENGFWVLLARFDKGELKTYFKNAPPPSGLGIDSVNKPVKQEFRYFASGEVFTSKNSQYEQWPDGAKTWAFSYDCKIKLASGRLADGCTTAIIQEVKGIPNEIRYSLFLVP